jgi:hypothetical protein
LIRASPSSILSLFGPNLGFFVVLGYLCYYIILDPVAAVSLEIGREKKRERKRKRGREKKRDSNILLKSLSAPFLITMSYTATKFLKTNPHATKIAIIIQIASWIFQFLGHGLAEKRSPKLLDNLVQGKL